MTINGLPPYYYYEDKQATFAGLGGAGDRARLSITDDFLGRPVP